jgi:hypothetical protein
LKQWLCEGLLAANLGGRRLLPGRFFVRTVSQERRVLEL